MSELKTYQLYIDGEWCDAEGGKTFESIEPSTATPWALMPEASEADVNRAVDAADRAMWSSPWCRARTRANGSGGCPSPIPGMIVPAAASPRAPPGSSIAP